jgi:hypothetical protein
MSGSTTSLPTWCCDTCGMSKMMCWCIERALGSGSLQHLEATETEFPSSIQCQRPESDMGYHSSRATLHSTPAQWPRNPVKTLGKPCSTICEHSEPLAGPLKYKSYAPAASLTKRFITASVLKFPSQSQITKKRRLSLFIDYPTPLNGYPSSDFQLHFEGKKRFSGTPKKPPQSNEFQDLQPSRAMSPSSKDVPIFQDRLNSIKFTGSIQKSVLGDEQLLFSSSEATIGNSPPDMPKCEHGPPSATKSRAGVHQTKLKYNHTLEVDRRILPPSYLSTSTSTSTEMPSKVSRSLQQPRPAERPYTSTYALKRSPTSSSKELGEGEQPAVAHNHHSTDATTSPANYNRANAPEKKIELFFEKPEGAIDLSNPLSAEKLWTLSLSEFFDSYSSHSGILPSTFDALAFTTAFGHHQRLVVRRDGSLAAWNKLRNRVRTFLELEKREKPDETEFEIWVERAAADSN